MDKDTKKSISILKKASEHSLTDEEYSLCCEKGLIIKPEKITHSELISKIQALAKEIPHEKAAEGFLYSISSSDMRYRTALSSLIWAKALPTHEAEVITGYSGKPRCAFCGAELDGAGNFSAEKLHSYAADRLFPKKVFMDICCAGYVLNDLTLFKSLPEQHFCGEDIRILNRIFGLVKELGSGNKVNALLKLIAADASLSLTGADAFSVLGVLSSCGVFDTPDRKSYASGFVPCNDRELIYENDVYYPLHIWRGKYGVNYDAVKDIFGDEIFSALSDENAISGKAERIPAKKKSSRAEQHFTDGVHLIDLDDRLRHYFGLSPMNSSWERMVTYSVTHCIYKRMEMFFDGDRLMKFIYEENAVADDGTQGFRTYTESDLDIMTNKRQTVLPKTSRGREQPLTASLINTPTYMKAHLTVGLGSHAFAFNSSNDQELPIPETLISCPEDFYEMAEKYIASLPDDYETQLYDFIHKKRKTVKFTAGDIFRIQLSPTEYTYCLILGKVREILKWKEVPKGHPLHSCMCQPIIYRQYRIRTTNANMTAEELSKCGLLPMRIAQDNFVLWETYPITARKKLEEKDIDLGFGYERGKVVWGLNCYDLGDDLLPELNGRSFDNYGMYLYIQYETEFPEDPNEPIETKTTRVRDKLAKKLGFGKDYSMDDFVKRFGGMSRQDYIDLAEKRFKQ